MTLKQLQDKVDAKLVTFWTNLKAKQDAYYAKHGKYFQMLVSPVDVVIDGLDTDYVERVPSDEKYVVDRDFSFTEKVPFQIRVDEWHKTNPDNILEVVDAGYKVAVYVQVPDGRVFTRSRDSKNVDSGWKQYNPSDV